MSALPLPDSDPWENAVACIQSSEILGNPPLKHLNQSTLRWNCRIYYFFSLFFNQPPQNCSEHCIAESVGFLRSPHEHLLFLFWCCSLPAISL